MNKYNNLHIAYNNYSCIYLIIPPCNNKLYIINFIDAIDVIDENIIKENNRRKKITKTAIRMFLLLISIIISCSVILLFFQ